MAKKRVATLVLSIALLLAVTVGGTLAYLTDTDSDVNVMTLGNVDIEQIEQQLGADGKTLETFVDNKELYPGTEVSKIVSVKNVGKSPAYVRTLIAIETIASDTFEYEASWETQGTKVGVFDCGDGKGYDLYVVTYPDVLKPEEVTAESLLGIALGKDGTNEDMAALGGSYEIPVLSQAVQTNGFANANAAFAAALPLTEENVEAWFAQMTNNGDFTFTVDIWDGTADTSWYNDTDTEFVIMTAEQLAGFAELVDGGNNFAGKTVKLGQNIDLSNIVFEPIGSYRKDTPFKGTFDGQNYTIFNMSQNTWALNNGYSYGDLGLGLFGLVEDATVKNLVMDNASISGESAICGTVAATAYGDCTFENITVSNSKVNDYQYYAGGIV
ncbi:MAG: hypothetical protein J6L88_05025, partial [Clostridia bacterium]|nr:hypothetical protein [Clostridia bacterium]